jgi:photosynthetic reaction center cytochrome c subunit
MTPREQILIPVTWAAVIVALLAGCDRESTQVGPRGTSMITIQDPDELEELARKNVVPEPVIASVAVDGPRAGDAFENVTVLADTSVPQFTRLMTAMTDWVAGDRGCVYCHVETDYASDALYTKVVARRMLEMTRHINASWRDHVAGTGVTCYTCHRGNPVPEHVWFQGHPEPQTGGLNARRRGQNLATSPITVSSLPYDPFTPLLLEDGNARTISTTALPTGKVGGRNATEDTYALMIHMSEALGVNCLFCHNSRAFYKWEESSPARVRAWHGIRMVRDINRGYLVPLESTFPQERLGPHGDAPKVFCTTCHQGVSKPLYGKSMLATYPSLRPQASSTTQDPGGDEAGANLQARRQAD